MEAARQQLLRVVSDLPESYVDKLLVVALYCKEKAAQGIDVKNLFDPLGMFSHWDNPDDDAAWSDL